jgi:hypothetical protein
MLIRVIVSWLAALGMACLLALPAAAQPAPPPPPATLGQYYLALGDSLAYGITDPAVPADPTCKAATAPGYVCIVYGYLKQIDAQLQLVNLSAPEVDSCVLVNGFGNGSPCANKPGPATLASPLQAAVSFIKAHPGQVGIVTINIGGADLVPLLPAAVQDPAGTAAKLPALFQAFQQNLDTALKQLRAAMGPNGEIVLATQYNPLGGIPSPPLPAGLPAIAASAINSLNGLMKTVAAHYAVRVADVAAAFDANPGGAALLTFVPTSLQGAVPNIYPLPEGYRVYATAVLKAIGLVAPLKVAAKLGKKTIKKRATDHMTGHTVADATVTLKLKLPGARSDTTVVQADNDGAFSWAFQAKTRTGKGSLTACAADAVAGKSVCTKKLSFTVK